MLRSRLLLLSSVKFANFTGPNPHCENAKFDAISAFKISKIKLNKIYTNFQFHPNFMQIWKFISNLDRILLARCKIYERIFMRNFILLFAAFLFTGCFGLFESSPEVAQASDGNAKGYKEVMRIKADCSSCASGGQDIKINGTDYTSDVAIKCCIAQSRIDTNAAIKKVYIHKIADERAADSGIKFISKNGAKMLYPKERLERLFHLFLQDELLNRGIMVVDSQTSPYTYRVDFAFTDYAASYSEPSQYLSAAMKGKLGVKNINKTRVLNISTRQDVRKLEAEDTQDFNLYVYLLVKQAANKAAEEISKL